MSLESVLNKASQAHLVASVPNQDRVYISVDSSIMLCKNNFTLTVLCVPPFQTYSWCFYNFLSYQKAATLLTRTCALVTGLLLFLLLPPLLFSAIEGWTYEEGFYYSFITLSTIGFGDYVIGKSLGFHHSHTSHRTEITGLHRVTLLHGRKRQLMISRWVSNTLTSSYSDTSVN